jgi:hypothetical protein
MKQMKAVVKLALCVAMVSMVQGGRAQVAPTATQQLELSAFGAATGTFTNIEGGKNVSITAGADLTFLALRLLRPSFEIRGSYPIDGGTIDAQRNFLLGPKVEHTFGRARPYVDFLIGRGQIDYQNGGFVVGNTLYISSISTIYSPGAGVDYHLTPRLAFKADIQYQHWDAPVVASGTIHPIAVSLGGVYRFNFNPRYHSR